jgi:D-aminoacyl-tRNA deacylase
VRAVVQRASRASVTVDGSVVASFEGPGLVILVGVWVDDTEVSAAALASKISTLRIFPDDDGVMNRSILEAGGQAIAVSQFTLHGDVRKGRRPSYITAAPPEQAKPLYEAFVRALRETGVPTGEGVFQAMMDVALVNDGPVTILVDTDKTF